MSDLQYDIGVNTANARRNIDELQKRVEKTSDTFGRLRSAIAGLAVGAFIRNTFLMANSLNDLANATGIARDQLLGFTQALAANGSTVDRARDGLTDFVKNLGEAANGSAELQRAFARVGVSLNDIATLSEQEILRKTIQGLADINDRASQSSTAMRIFGESFKGVDVAGVNRDLDGFIAKSAETAESLRTAGEVSQSLKNTFFELQLAVLEALQPFAEFANALLENREAVSRLIEVVVNLGMALAALYTFNKAAAFGRMLIGVNGAIAASMRRTAGAARGVKLGLMEMASISATINMASLRGSLAGVIRGLRGLRIAAIATARALVGLIPVVGQLIVVYQVLSEVVDTLTGKDIGAWINTWADKLEEVVTNTFPGLAKGINELGDALGLEKSDRYKESLGLAKDEVDETNDLLDEQNNKHGNIRDVINSQAEAARRLFETYERTNETTLRTLRQQRDMLGLTDAQAEMQRNLNNVTNNYEDQLDTLLNQYDELAKKPRENADQMAVLLETINRVTGEYQEQYAAVAVITAEIVEQRKQLEAAREAQEAAAEAARQLQDAMRGATDFTRELNESTRDLRRDLAQLNMTPLERDIDDITNKINDDLADAIRDLKAIRNESNADEIDREIERITIAANKAIETQTRMARESAREQRTFANGWNKAFQQYQDDATNAAKTAEKVFEQTTQGIEDMLVGFTKTGKFEWEDFVAELTDTLLRSELKKLIGTTFGSLGLGSIGGSGSGQARGENASTPLYVQDVNGGLGGGVGGLGGAATGGSSGGILGGLGGLLGTDARTPGINPSASSGGGFLDTVGSVFGGIKDTVSGWFGGGNKANSFSRDTPYAPTQSRRGSDLGSGSFLSNIGSTISNAASSVGDWFGGFFANGGFLPAGKFGIAGENGPELITGPANITPGVPGGGGSNVTYNINAVDAASFKAMIARDPGFIHAVAQKGAQSVPRGR